MIAGNAFGMPARGRDGSDLQRGGVAGEYALFRYDRFQASEQFALGLQFLDDGLDDHMAAGQGFQFVGHCQIAGCTLCRIGRELSLFDQLGEGVDDVAPGGERSVCTGVMQQNLDSGLGGDLGDAPTHDTGADDGNCKIRAQDVQGSGWQHRKGLKKDEF